MVSMLLPLNSKALKYVLALVNNPIECLGDKLNMNEGPSISMFV